MKATFVELPAFQRLREAYLDDGAFKKLQNVLMENPEAGDPIPGTGGLRKMRFSDKRRSKGTRGGLRVIYFWKTSDAQFWLFTLYDKNEAQDLTPDECATLKRALHAEIKARSAKK